MKFNSILGLQSIAVAEGAVSPVPPNGAGSIAFSSTLSKVVVWTGTAWSSNTSAGGAAVAPSISRTFLMMGG